MVIVAADGLDLRMGLRQSLEGGLRGAGGQLAGMEVPAGIEHEVDAGPGEKQHNSQQDGRRCGDDQLLFSWFHGHRLPPLKTQILFILTFLI